MDIEKKVIQIVVKLLAITSSGSITVNSNLGEDLGADDLDIVEIVMELEKDFNIYLPDSVLEQAKTITDLVKEVENALVNSPKKLPEVKTPKKTVHKRVIKFTEYTYDDGTKSLKPNTTSFNDFELVGILSYFCDVFKVSMMQGNKKK